MNCGPALKVPPANSGAKGSPPSVPTAQVALLDDGPHDGQDDGRADSHVRDWWVEVKVAGDGIPHTFVMFTMPATDRDAAQRALRAIGRALIGTPPVDGTLSPAWRRDATDADDLPF